MDKVSLYANVGAQLTHYVVDTRSATLTRRGTVELPANVQYAWPHASRRFLYVATSDSKPGMSQTGTTHRVSALSIDSTGALSPHGAAIALPSRPIHVSTDILSRHILVAFNDPGAIRVYRINQDATPGKEVLQSEAINPGIFPHQVRATPDNRQVILVARGHDAMGGKSEEPGSLKVFNYHDGTLSNEVSIAPDGGFGFGPRHLDFHPSKPWVYVSLERQNALDMFELNNGTLSPLPLFRKGTLAGPATPHRQAVGTVHVHPSGHSVYVANRASESVTLAGRRVFAGGENSLAVYAIDLMTGEPKLIQHIDTQGIHPRTFHIDPSGRLLIAAHIMGLTVRDGDAIRHVPAGLSHFHIAGDGRLEFVRAYDIDVGNHTMWWMGIV